jgi:hypothetical protein
VSGKGFIAADEFHEACELCGKVEELRPYGHNGEDICFACGMQDNKSAEKAAVRLLGISEGKPTDYPVDAKLINDWRINYGLDTRSPADAMRWWHDNMEGKCPAGAVAALGLCIEEIERLQAELAEARRDAEAARADYRCALQYIDRLRNERDAAIDAARGEP